MTVRFAHRARFVLETFEGRAMMSASLAAPTPEPVELRYELKDVVVSSVQPQLTKVGPGTLVFPNTNSAAGHTLYQDIFIPVNQSSAGTGGGAGKVQMQDFHFMTTAAHGVGGGGGAGKVSMNDISFDEETPEDGMLLPAIQKVRDAAARVDAGDGLDAMTDLAGVPVDDGLKGPKTAGYDLKVNKKV